MENLTIISKSIDYQLNFAPVAFLFITN